MKTVIDGLLQALSDFLEEVFAGKSEPEVKRLVDRDPGEMVPETEIPFELPPEHSFPLRDSGADQLIGKRILGMGSGQDDEFLMWIQNAR